MIIINSNKECFSCGNKNIKPVNKMILSVKVQDATAPAWITLFHDQAIGLFNKQIDELAHDFETNEEKHSANMKSCQHRLLEIKVKVQIDNFNKEETRVKFNASYARPVNFVRNSKRLLNEIGQMINL